MRFGNGTGGSRSITATGQAIVEASALVVEKGKKAAAHMLEASEADIEFGQGRFTIAGTDRSIGIMELAERMRDSKMPEGTPETLDVDHATKETASTFPNGCHVAEVEIDPDTGVTRIVRYSAVNDFGTVVNPMIVAGQLHGGVAQGIGQALMEEVSYDGSGPADHRLLHGLRAAARRRRAVDAGRRSPLAGEIQSARHQGLRRSRLRRQPRLHRQRRGGCTVGVRHQAHQHAADARTRLARDPGRQGEGGVRARLHHHSPLSSPAKAGDPVFQRESNC
ncbi:hypothetical protein ACVWY2_000457 [Bradyrhizobium sp. JR6.1]